MNASSLNQSTIFKIRKYCDYQTFSIKEKIYARRLGITDVVTIIIMNKFIDEKKIYTPKDIVEYMRAEVAWCLLNLYASLESERYKMLHGNPAESYKCGE